MKDVFNLSDHTFNVLKWVAITALPAINLCVCAILGATGITSETTALVSTIISALATLLGTLLGVSTIKYYSNNTTSTEESEG